MSSYLDKSPLGPVGATQGEIEHVWLALSYHAEQKY